MISILGFAWLAHIGYSTEWLSIVVGFEVFQTLDSPVKSMAMHNFLQIYTNNIHAAMQDTMGQSANPPTGNEDGQDDQDDKD